jgi:hypothetical protein
MEADSQYAHDLARKAIRDFLGEPAEVNSAGAPAGAGGAFAAGLRGARGGGIGGRPAPVYQKRVPRAAVNPRPIPTHSAAAAVALTPRWQAVLAALLRLGRATLPDVSRACKGLPQRQARHALLVLMQHNFARAWLQPEEAFVTGVRPAHHLYEPCTDWVLQIYRRDAGGAPRGRRGPGGAGLGACGCVACGWEEGGRRRPGRGGARPGRCDRAGRTHTRTHARTQHTHTHAHTQTRTHAHTRPPPQTTQTRPTGAPRSCTSSTSRSSTTRPAWRQTPTSRGRSCLCSWTTAA